MIKFNHGGITVDLKQFEEWIRTAQFERVRHELRELKIGRLKRNEFAIIANYANRVGCPLVALKVLNPVFRDGRAQASANEIIQYGHALRRLGAAEEALQVLEKVDANNHAEVLLQKANCHATMWQYREAVPLLRAYIERLDPDSYAWRVAYINLLAALIDTEDSAGVEEALAALDSRLDANQTPLVYGNYLELQARWAVNSQRPEAAVELSGRAISIMSSAHGTWDAFQAEKWIAVGRSLMAGRVLPELDGIKRRAVSKGQFEVSRDCDFYTAQINRDDVLFTHLYFGSPFQSYREKILARMTNRNIPADYVWPGDEGRKVLDVRDGTVDGGESGLKLGQAVHRLLLILSSDFYKPFTLLTVFSKITGGAYFDPNHSANRVHQTMTRFRKWAATIGLPLEIDAVSGGFRFNFSRGGAVLVPRDQTPANSNVLHINKIKSHLGDEFSSEEVKKVLGQSATNTLRLLRWAQADGRVVPIGTGHYRKYRFVA